MLNEEPLRMEFPNEFKKRMEFLREMWQLVEEYRLFVRMGKRKKYQVNNIELFNAGILISTNTLPSRRCWRTAIRSWQMSTRGKT